MHSCHAPPRNKLGEREFGNHAGLAVFTVLTAALPLLKWLYRWQSQGSGAGDTVTHHHELPTGDARAPRSVSSWCCEPLAAACRSGERDSEDLGAEVGSGRENSRARSSARTRLF